MRPLFIKKIKKSIKNIILSFSYRLAKGWSVPVLGSVEFKSTLFMCYGNIIRSPFCECYFKSKLPSTAKIDAISAGFYEKTGRTSPRNAQEVAADEYSIDLSSHRSKTISEEMVAKSTIVIGMHYSHYTEFIKQFQHEKNKFYLLKHISNPHSLLLNISDPYGKGKNEFKKCYSDLSQSLGRLVDQFIINDNPKILQQMADQRDKQEANQRQGPHQKVN